MNDIKNYYTEHGAGFPLILLHGNGEDSTYFKNQIDFFSNFYRVIAVDTRGHGKTPRGDKPFTIRQFADDLYEFMTDMKIDSAHILGFSDGANIALCFALKYPHMINMLILNGADLFPAGVKRSIQIPIEIGYRITKFFSKKSPKAKFKSEMLGLMTNDPNIEPKALEELNIRTLVIVGDNDMITRKHTELIYSSLPDAKLEIIKGDHFIANKNPDIFNEKVYKFLSEPTK